MKSETENKPTHRFVSKKKTVTMDVIISPEELNTILTHYSEFNRPINRKKVLQFKHDLLNGQWNVDAGISIKFDRDGCLMDGRHRISAACELGIPFTTDVCYGLSPEAILVQDIGQERRPHINPVLFEAQRTGEIPEKAQFHHRKYVQSITRLVMANEMGKQWTSPSECELETKYALDKEFIDLACARGTEKWMRKPGPRAAIAIYAKKDKAKALKFRDKLFNDGSGFKSGDPILLLRNRLVAPSKGGSMPREDTEFTINTIHLYHGGDTAKRLRKQQDWNF